MMWEHWHEGAGACGGWGVGFFLGLFFLAVVVGLIIWGIVALVRHSRSGSAGRGNGALTIVRERYARGEVSKEEFDRIKKDLS